MTAFDSDTDPFTALTSEQRLKLYGFSIVTGVLGAHAGLAIFYGLTELQSAIYSLDPEIWNSLPWWHFVAPVVATGLICAMISRWLAPSGKPEGIPQIISAVHGLDSQPLTLKAGLCTAAQSILTLGSGGSAGREGPAVHFASVLTLSLSQKFRLEAGFTPYLVGSATAAAVAASFDAPFAAMVFSLEVVSRRISLKNAAPIVVAAAIGATFNHLYEFEVGILHIEGAGRPTLVEYIYFCILAVICALMSAAMIRSIFLVEALHNCLQIPYFSRPLLGGLCVGLLIWQAPWVMGVGVELARATLDTEFSIFELVSLIVFKILAVGLTLGSRFAGGVFSPALVLGCMAGSAFGLFLGDMGSNTAPSLYAVAAMGAVAAATLGAPISTILMTFEMTRNVDAIVPVMVTVVLCTVLARRLTGWSFFDLMIWHARKASPLPKRAVTDETG